MTPYRLKVIVVDEEVIAGGVETLRVNLLPELAGLCESLVWVVPQPHCQRFRNRMHAVPNLVVESLSWPTGTLPQIFGALIRRMRSFLPRAVRERFLRWSINARVRRLARLHSAAPCLTTCVFSQPPPNSGLPLAAFVCDVNPAIPEQVRGNLIRWLRTADAIFGISEFTCNELRRLDPDSSAKIHAIPLAAPPAKPVPSAGYHQSKIDFYFPAASNPHKGHMVLFQACMLLARRGLGFRLVISGPGVERFRKGRMFANPEMDEARRFLEDNSHQLARCITVAGDVEADVVKALYSSAKCVVLPSRYEGFGLPLAEALRYGKEIVCSDIPPFREQVALYSAFDRVRVVPPSDSERLAETMEQVLKSAPEPQISPDELDRRMARWTWTDAARRCYDHLLILSSLCP
jgi:glycosyltransferase involved in cell wall biosynthesis